MESSNAAKQQADAASAGKPARPHWRHRDPSAIAVYVVHPAQFRDVVQQLTGAAASPATTTHGYQSGATNGTCTATATAAAATNNAAQQQQQQRGSGGRRGEESSSRQRTLGQMHQECLAWANCDDDDY